jgi:hypothetical protein
LGARGGGGCLTLMKDVPSSPAAASLQCRGCLQMSFLGRCPSSPAASCRHDIILYTPREAHYEESTHHASSANNLLRTCSVGGKQRAHSSTMVGSHNSLGQTSWESCGALCHAGIFVLQPQQGSEIQPSAPGRTGPSHWCQPWMTLGTPWVAQQTSQVSQEGQI